MSHDTPDGLPSESDYALASSALPRIPAPVLPYRPPMPRDRGAPIALIGAGGISAAHLDAYQTHGFNVVAIADRHLDRAEARRDRFFPGALATTDIDAVLRDPAIRVVDLAMHIEARVPLTVRALEAGKHVLAQKPFVADLASGEALVALAASKGLVLAVNQNGRWAPHMAYIREAVQAGLIGEVIGVHCAIAWDHSWIAGTPFEKLDQIILEDFAIHWFDFLVSLIGDSATAVHATGTAATGQRIASRLLAQAMISFPGGQASLVFDGATRHGAANTTSVIGTRGTLRATGPDLGQQRVTLHLERGDATPELEGQWFNDGFAGTMGALLVAAETGIPPSNNARDNLQALRLANAALQSARSGATVLLR